MNRTFATTTARLAFLAVLFFQLTFAATAGTPTVQVLFYNGEVSIKTEGGEQALRIGQELSLEDQLLVRRGGSIQISVNGKVFSFNAQRNPIRVGDAVAKVGEENNKGVATSILALGAAAQMIQINQELDAAEDGIPLLASLDGGAVTSIVEEAEATTVPVKTIKVARLRSAQPVILEPRATAVTRGPLRFSWLGASNVETYLIRVLDRYDMEVFRTTTSDTTFLWEGAELYAESDYTWELSSASDTLTPVKATFRRLNDLAGMSVEAGESQIRLELGNKNPALPVILAAHFANKGCHADAARYYLEGARRNPQHASLLIALAMDQYRSNMGATDSELNAIEAAMKGAE